MLCTLSCLPQENVPQFLFLKKNQQDFNLYVHNSPFTSSSILSFLRHGIYETSAIALSTPPRFPGARKSEPKHADPKKNSKEVPEKPAGRTTKKPTSSPVAKEQDDGEAEREKERQRRREMEEEASSWFEEQDEDAPQDADADVAQDEAEAEEIDAD